MNIIFTKQVISWASIRGKPFLCLHDETRANLKDATVHQDPKRWAFGRRYEASPSSVCAMRRLPAVRMQPYTRILNAGLVGVVQKRVPFFCLRDETCANCRDADCTPGSQALGLRASFDGEPFLCLNRETLPTSGMRLYTRIPSAGLVGVVWRRALPQR